MAIIKNKAERDFRLVTSSIQPKQDFNKIKIGKSVINDVTADINFFGKDNRRRFSRRTIEDAITNFDVSTMRSISNYYFTKSGIYQRLCRYMAYLYRYDWFLTPVLENLENPVKNSIVSRQWIQATRFLEACKLKKTFGDIALKVIKNGCYYGCIVSQESASFIQELPVEYCRSRYEINGRPAVEFNIKYFNDAFSDTGYRLRVLKMFPQEFQKAYAAYQKGTLTSDFQGDEAGWFLVNPEIGIKFNLTNNDAPLFIAVIPELLDLEEAKALDKKKMAQQILKIIIQKMPVDKNGELIFDVEEAQALHSNAVEMLSQAIGVDVLTTFADVDVADLSDRGNVSSVDQLNKVERSVYNEAGVSQMQFNTDGNLALEKSISNDEATMYDLLLQFGDYAETLVKRFNLNREGLSFSVQMLPTTIYNYKELSKIYKEQTMLGFSKLLPQVALGQAQSTVIATAYFENIVMNLDELFIAPQMSSTMSGNDSKNKNKHPLDPSGQGSQGGRPELPDDKKSTKTLQNKESEG